MNKVIIMGRLTREPNVTYTQGEQQMAVARFTVAVDRPGARNSQDRNQPTADFISCVAFGQQGAFAEQYLHQGTKIVLEGRIQTGSYTNQQGQRVYTTDVVAERIEFAESKAAQQNHPNAADPGYTMQQGQEYYIQQPPQQPSGSAVPTRQPAQQRARSSAAGRSQASAARSTRNSAAPTQQARATQNSAQQEGFINMDNVPLDDEGLPF